MEQQNTEEYPSDSDEFLEGTETTVYEGDHFSEGTYDPQEVAQEFVEKANTSFSTIAGIKEAFFRSIYDDGRWNHCFDYQDESRKFSTFVRIVFTSTNKHRAEKGSDELSFPSSTEVNDWYVFFRRRQQFTAKGVRKKLLPKNRGIQNALQSATVDVANEPDRVEKQLAILEKVDQEGLPLTANSIRKIASDMGIKKSLPPKPEGQKQLIDVGPDDWTKILGLIEQGTIVLHSSLSPEDEHSKMLSIFRKLRELTRAPEVYVFGCFDEKDCFVSFVVQCHQGYLIFPEHIEKQELTNTYTVETARKKGWKDLGYKSEAWQTACHPTIAEESMTEILEKWKPIKNKEGLVDPLLFYRIAFSKSARDVVNLAATISDRLPYKIHPIPLVLYDYWRTRTPEGAYIDEIMEPMERNSED